MGTARTVLTTGANSGIGLATVVELARRGHRSVGSVRSDEKAEIVAKAAADAGVEVRTVLLDVDDADRSAEVIDEIRPWGLVNNAGAPTTGAVEDVGDDEARASLETMVIAPMRLARLALAHMRDGGEGGRIVNVSSLLGKTSWGLVGWYQAAKHALEAVSDALRIEVARDGIDVVLVEPGGVRTAIWDGNQKALAERAGTRYSAAYERLLTLTRLTEMTNAEPAGCAKTIASAIEAKHPRSRYVVGLDAQAGIALDALTPTFVKDRATRLLLGL